jgi:transcriptional regulator with XRE-family HTH domain
VAQRVKKASGGPESLHKSFGARVRYFRLTIGLSQEQLAEHCGLDRAYVGGIERGERNPSLKNIGKIAAALNVPISALFDKSGQSPSLPSKAAK